MGPEPLCSDFRNTCHELYGPRSWGLAFPVPELRCDTSFILLLVTGELTGLCNYHVPTETPSFGLAFQSNTAR